MRILTGLVFIINLLLWIIGGVIAFFADSLLIGLPVLIGFIGFLIAWHLSGGIVIAPADYFFQPEWSVFKIKLKWSNSTGGIVLLVAFLIIGSIWG